MTIDEDPDVATDEDDDYQCSTCGAPVDSAEWHPAATTTDEDGSLQVLVFCSGACRTAHRTTDSR